MGLSAIHARALIGVGWLVVVSGCGLVGLDGLVGDGVDAGLKVRPDASFAAPLDGADDAAVEASDASDEEVEGTDAGSDDVDARADRDGALANDAAAKDAATPDAKGGGCGPLDTVDNCSACGTACDTTTGTPSCDGTSCGYTCNAGRADCNQGAPDTDGCECATPGCCGSGCQTTHSDGLGQNFYDCSPTGTVSDPAALEACDAFSDAGTSACSDGWTCPNDSTSYVCFAPNGDPNLCTTCWGYSGRNRGKVYDCNCPSGFLGTWN